MQNDSTPSSRGGAVAAWLAQIRANFLLLAVLLVALGAALAAQDLQKGGREFDVVRALLVLIGTLAAHVSVNLFNEYSDYKTQIDFQTERTPFSGGSGMLVSGRTSPRAVQGLAWAMLFVALLVALYFAFTAHWIIMAIAGVGAFAIVGYTGFLARILLGEIAAGLTLGTLVVLGSYIALTALPEMEFALLLDPRILWLSIPPGMLTGLLLLLNEIPDADADRAGGRRHLVIAFGKRGAAYLYGLGLAGVYGIIALLPPAGLADWLVYIALAPAPLAVKVCIDAVRHAHDTPRLTPALGLNVLVVLGTDAMLALYVMLELAGL